MCLFGKKSEQIDIDNIASVVIIEKTQLYINRSRWGLSFGATIGDSRVMAMEGSTPAGAEIKFSVTYNNGRTEIVKAMSGTDLCDRLLQLALDPAPVQNSRQNDDKEYSPVSLGKNELPAGRYLIGKDIPEGTYDFTWVWGHGSMGKYQNDHDTTLGACTFTQ